MLASPRRPLGLYDQPGTAYGRFTRAIAQPFKLTIVADPIPSYEGPRTYFVLAEIEPHESMNFGVTSGIAVASEGDRLEVLEVVGHMLGWWMTSPEEIAFDTLRVRAQDLFDVSLAIDALLRLGEGVERQFLARRAVTHSWIEAREVLARANIVGSVHSRYGLIPGEMDGVDAQRFTRAANAATAVVEAPTARVALKDFGFSLTQRGDDAFLYAYRAVENVRRSYAPDKISSSGNVQPVWLPMHQALGTSETALNPLTAAAVCIRHGETSGAALQSVRTEPAREQTLSLADRVLRGFLAERSFI